MSDESNIQRWNGEPTEEELRRWRLILGGGGGDGIQYTLIDPEDMGMDSVLESVYGQNEGQGGLGDSAPNVARWLGDIRQYFPVEVVKLLQRDAIDRLNLQQLLMEPEMLLNTEPDVHLVATLLSLNEVMPAETRSTARQVVQKVVEELEKKLATPMRQAISGAINRSVRNRRPRYNEMDWTRTILTNLKHYQPEYQTIVPEKRIGYGHRKNALRDVILCIDQSGSMSASVVYASIFGAVMASIAALRTYLVVFDTAVVDLTQSLSDPVDLLFGTQLGGGTDINRALAYCQTLITRPQETILVLISDLFEGGDSEMMIRRVRSLVGQRVQVITLLALNDEGSPRFDQNVAAIFADMGVPAFACTPDRFPDLMAAAINRHDLSTWAANHGIVTAHAVNPK
ncbi:MAG: VWA domain-containing protein [Anaerolinea sp.]|nr:VWA domain-containing protein [Anaerolinea sp.]